MAFQKVNFKEEPRNRTPILSVSQTHICFGKGTLIELGYPERAVILLDEEERLLLVQESDSSDPLSIPFGQDNGGVRNELVRIKTTTLRKKINALTGLTPQRNQAYRVAGEFTDRYGGGGVIFNLKNAYFPKEK